MNLRSALLCGLLGLAGCDLTLEDRRYGCAESGDCPDDMHCWSDGLCRAMVETDAGGPDAGTPDAGPSCGDGNVDVGEECDDGNVLSDDGCTSCAVNDGFACMGAPSSCTTRCGDSMAVGLEVCDDGNASTETECAYGTPTCTLCDAACSNRLDLIGPFCGDSSVHLATETCDDGNTVNEDECEYGTPSCTTCNVDCSAELSLGGRICGDDVVDPEEECDFLSSDGCTSCGFDALVRVAGGNIPWMSADARWVAFMVRGPGLVPEDGDTLEDVYVRDTASDGPAILVSRSADGSASADAPTFPWGVSADGDVVVMHSRATNLHAAVTDGDMDVFVYTRSTDTMEAISSATAPGVGAQDPAISGDGRFVSYWTTEAAISGDGSRRHVVLYDRVAGTHELVSVNTMGDPGTSNSMHSSVSHDGRYVAFQSEARNIDGPETCCNSWDIFVRDRVAGTTTRVSVATDGRHADQESRRPRISPNGRYVAFVSLATNLVIGDTNGLRDVFVHDRTSRVTSRVTLREDGSETATESTQFAVGAVSDTGEVVFSTPDPLVAADEDASDDVYVWDIATGGLRIASMALDGTSVDVASTTSRITPDGRVVIFFGNGRDLTGGCCAGTYRREP